MSQMTVPGLGTSLFPSSLSAILAPLDSSASAGSTGGAATSSPRRLQESWPHVGPTIAGAHSEGHAEADNSALNRAKALLLGEMRKVSTHDITSHGVVGSAAGPLPSAGPPGKLCLFSRCIDSDDSAPNIFNVDASCSSIAEQGEALLAMPSTVWGNVGRTSGSAQEAGVSTVAQPDRVVIEAETLLHQPACPSNELPIAPSQPMVSTSGVDSDEVAAPLVSPTGAVRRRQHLSEVTLQRAQDLKGTRPIAHHLSKADASTFAPFPSSLMPLPPPPPPSSQDASPAPMLFPAGDRARALLQAEMRRVSDSKAQEGGKGAPLRKDAPVVAAAAAQAASVATTAPHPFTRSADDEGRASARRRR